MKKVSLAVFLVLICCLALTGCQCKHDYADATCTDPKTCKRCGAIEGTNLGHSFVNYVSNNDATCTADGTKTAKCERCDTHDTITDAGSAKGHDYADATCTEPKACKHCGEAVEDALGHSWLEATCTDPKTCETCAQTEGAPLGHSWLAATCDTPKTCEVCSTTEGTAAGHQWTEATCTTPKTCKACNVTEGDAPGHRWTAATTENPKTCTVCKKTEGSRIVTDSRFRTENCKKFFGSWVNRTEYSAADLGLNNVSGTYAEVSVYTFNNDGTATMSMEIENYEVCQKLMIAASAKEIYDLFDSKEDADAYMQSNFGMNVEEYSKDYCKTYMENLTSTAVNCVYYVSGDTLYMGANWKSELEGCHYFLEGGILRLIDSEGDHLELIRR